MNLIQKLRVNIRKKLFLRKFIAFKLIPTGWFDRWVMNRPLDETWKRRLEITLESTDNDRIQTVHNAGHIIKGKQVMHNGLRINLGSYYGPEVAQILKMNKGIHEPQEEYVFQEVLKVLPDKATMIELGAFWGFYSMWFNKEVLHPKNYLIEPDSFNLVSGKLNFRLNKMKGSFDQFFIGKNSDPSKNLINMDWFIEEKQLDTIHILHSDIQGFEYDMLLGAEMTLKRTWFLFISTHSNEVHRKCRNHLVGHNFTILAEADKGQSYSEDGLIVAQSPNIHLIKPIKISLRGQI